MNKLQILLITMLALGLACCGQKNTDQPQGDPTRINSENQVETASSFWKTLDLFYVKEGGLYFYSIKDGDAAHYPNEPDSIVDALYSKNGILYYNVVSNDRLLLKSIDLNVDDPMPEQLVDWNVPVKSNSEYGMTPYGKISFNPDKTKIGLERDRTWFTGVYYNLAVYDIATKEVALYELYRPVDFEEFGYPYEDLPDESGFYSSNSEEAPSNPMNGLFEVEDHVYYVGNGQKTCLTDKIDFEHGFGFDLDGEGFNLSPETLDPTGKRVLISASTYMGDGEIGFYMVSSIDGKEQMELPGSDYIESNPQWLPDGRLVYVGFIDGTGIFLWEPDGNVRFVDESDIFCVLN